MKLVKVILFLVLVAFAGHANSQELTARAHALYTAKDYDSACVVIDAAIQTNEKYNSQTWQLRGLIYRKLETPERPEFRQVAIESFVYARETDTTGIYKDKINEYLYNTIIRYYNDAVTFLNEGRYVESEKCYLLYKETFNSLLDPAKSFVAEDIEYYNALGGGYTRQLGSLSGKDFEITFTLALNALARVLEVDSMNYLANLNSAVLYYNRGADLIVNLDPLNTDLDVLQNSIDVAEQLFKKALPLMLKAHAISPNNVEVIEGLTGIYYSLNDMENYLIYQTQLDKINLPKYLALYEKEPSNRANLEELVRIYSTTLKDETQYLKFKTILDQLGG